MNPLDGILSQLNNTKKQLDSEIEQLEKNEHIFGLISAKYISCGKKNCRCAKGKEHFHGPYFYLRKEPDYKYKEYLGKRIPKEIQEKVEIGKKIKQLEKRKKRIDQTITKLGKFLLNS